VQLLHEFSVKSILIPTLGLVAAAIEWCSQGSNAGVQVCLNKRQDLFGSVPALAMSTLQDGVVRLRCTV